MKRVGSWVICGLLLTAATLKQAEAQPTPVILPGTDQRLLRSTVGDIGYKLYVSLPRQYRTSGEDYPVLYLLDADYSFAIARNVVEHLSDRGDLPSLIVVGIAYDGPPAYRLNRTRDYTPSPVPTGGYGSAYQAVSGGGPLFSQFIADDLIPFIEREYRATSERVLVGHSYGGLFATWVALTAPDLFDGYVIVSPSLWYDDGMIFDQEQHLAEHRDDLPVRLYVGVGSREINHQHDMVADLRRLASRLEARGYPGLRLRSEVAADETHNSIFPRAFSNGLRFVFSRRE